MQRERRSARSAYFQPLGVVERYTRYHNMQGSLHARPTQTLAAPVLLHHEPSGVFERATAAASPQRTDTSFD